LQNLHRPQSRRPLFCFPPGLTGGLPRSNAGMYRQGGTGLSRQIGFNAFV
jgi:hypothetical protein